MVRLLFIINYTVDGDVLTTNNYQHESYCVWLFLHTWYEFLTYFQLQNQFPNNPYKHYLFLFNFKVSSVKLTRTVNNCEVNSDFSY